MGGPISRQKGLVVEELCQDSDCRARGDTHWHPFTVEFLLAEGEGEYTITVRVRKSRRVDQKRRP
jgi:hypothetical protein